jgi:hypothetical protein
MPPTTRSKTRKVKTPSPRVAAPLEIIEEEVSHALTSKNKSKSKTLKKSLSAHAKIVDALQNLEKVSVSSKLPRKTSKNKFGKVKSQFMWRSLVSNLREYTLKTLCSDAGVCLAFGVLSDKIKRNFDGFTSFRYAVSPVKRIGTPSENGFINAIQYVRNEYTSYAVLKSSAKQSADNLMYEYDVGQFINKLNTLFPCFLETYGVYKYKNNAVWQKLKDNKTNDIDVVKTGLDQISVDYGVACQNSTQIAILIQYLNGVIPLEDCVTNERFVENDLLSSLFQIYVPLGKLKDYFTHYDLHMGNIQLYKPVDGKYIEYHYHISPTKTVSFKSGYIAKIIDYGRCFFYNSNDFFADAHSDDLNSKHIYDSVLCKTKKCNDNIVVEDDDTKKKTKKKNNCGFYSGFGWLKDDASNPSASFYISSQHKNVSHDMRALFEVREYLTKHNKTQMSKPHLKWLSKVAYKERYGTQQSLNSGLPSALYNVEDVASLLVDLVGTAAFKTQNNAAYASKTKLGDLHVYMNLFPMDYTSALPANAFLKSKAIV